MGWREVTGKGNGTSQRFSSRLARLAASWLMVQYVVSYIEAPSKSEVRQVVGPPSAPVILSGLIMDQS